MRAVHLVAVFACALAGNQGDSSEETSSDPPAVVPMSLKTRPLGRSGYDDVYAPLLPPIQFPFHYTMDELSPFQQETLGLNKKRTPIRRLGKRRRNDDNAQGNDDAARSNNSLPWFDLSAAVARSIVDPVRIPELRFTTPPSMDKGPVGHAEFLQDSFFLKDKQVQRINWTTCKEFGKNAYFHPQEITNLNWVPFYIWSTVQMPGDIHRFTVPTKRIVESYRSKQERFFNFTLDWKQPKLLLQEGDTEVLLIALDRRGKFRALPWIAGLDEASIMVIRPMTVHLKIEAPYLVYMHCDMHHTTIMAVMGTGPKTNRQKIEEAESIGFVGVGYPVRLWAGPPRRPKGRPDSREYRGPPQHHRQPSRTRTTARTRKRLQRWPY